MATTSASDALVNLLGANSSITDMSKLELEYFIEILKEEQSRRNKASKVRQIRDIMPIEDWIESEYMLGPDASGIYPYWKQFVVDIFRDTRKTSEKINNVLISGSIGTGKSCLNENTRIPTSLGLMKLKDLKKAFESGKRFTVRAETGVKPCIDVYDNGVADTKKIKFKSGREVEGTYNHKLRFVRDGKIEWVKFEDVKVGDKVKILCELLPFGSESLDLDEALSLGQEHLIDDRIFRGDRDTIESYLRGTMLLTAGYAVDESEYFVRSLGELVSMLGIDYSIRQCACGYVIETESREDKDSVFDEVVSIEDGRCHTYDLTIEDDHSYCFGGFISHNTVSEIIMLRKLYELSCFENINAMFHLMSKTNIMFLYFSVNKNQAVNTGYGEFRSMVDASPYFRENFPRRKGLDSILIFPEGVTFAYGSRSSDAIGMSVICAMLDEANFVAGNGNNTSGNAEKALDMFAGIVNRANSRFIMDGGINHALNILVSSSTHESSATARQMSLSKDDPHTIITAPSQWEVKPEKFSKEFFYVFKGSNYLEPSIVNSVDDVNNFRLSVGLPKDKYRDGLEDFASIEREVQELPPHHQERFLKVPVDLRSGFEMNIIRSLQDLGGVSVGSTGKLFSSPIAYEGCVSKELQHPFIANEIVISTGDQIQVRDYLSTSFKLKHPERPRFIHIDQSFRSDSTGISSVYVDDVIEQDGVRKPIFAVDFMLRINPPNPPKKIAIYKIRDFVVFLHNRLGMKIGKITYDIFSSEESRQILEEMGFNVGYQSVDRTDKAYLDLVEVMYEGRLKIYDYPILRHELFNLIHYRDKRKVDHPKTVEGSDYSGKGAQEGSKDVSDSLAGALQSALQGSLMEETDAGRTLEDFLKANETRTYFEPDAMTVEELVDRQIDDMIEEMESQLDGFTMGGIAGFNGF